MMKKIYTNMARYPLYITGPKKKSITYRNMLCNL